MHEVTGGLTGTVGIASSKFLAKVASELDKPDGLTVVPPGTELELLRPMKVTVIPGVGPATAERLRRAGIHTIAELEEVSEDELVRLLGQAHGHGLFAARARRGRPSGRGGAGGQVDQRRGHLRHRPHRPPADGGPAPRQATEVGERLRKHGLSGRTVSIKVRLHDFTTLSRSSTLSSPTDDGATIARVARALLGDLDTSGGVRLLGVGVSGLADWIQEDLFGESGHGRARDRPAARAPAACLPPGADVVHDEMGPGWVWGSGSGVVTVRFETAETPPGPGTQLPVDDPALHRWEPPPED